MQEIKIVRVFVEGYAGKEIAQRFKQRATFAFAEYEGPTGSNYQDLYALTDQPLQLDDLRLFNDHARVVVGEIPFEKIIVVRFLKSAQRDVRISPALANEATTLFNK